MTDRDRQVLRGLVAGRVDQLLPVTRLGVAWRPAFEAEAARLDVLARNRRVNTEERQDAELWALAHRFVLEEVCDG